MSKEQPKETNAEYVEYVARSLFSVFLQYDEPAQIFQDAKELCARLKAADKELALHKSGARMKELEGKNRELRKRVAELEGMFDVKSYIATQKEWSNIVFGNGLRTEGICKHIESELGEIRAAPTDVMEWVDVIILALDGAWRSGHSTDEILWAMVKKQMKNLQRKWHPQNSGDKPVFHVKEASQ